MNPIEHLPNTRMLLPRLRAAWPIWTRPNQPSAWLEQLVRSRLDTLPLPASGATLQRWQALSAVAEHDLSLAKLYEGHTDALAVMAEVAPAFQPPPGATWGMWAAESPQARCVIESTAGSGPMRLSGAKSWCSGAAHVQPRPAHRLVRRRPRAATGVPAHAPAVGRVGARRRMAGRRHGRQRQPGHRLARRIGRRSWASLGAYLSRPGFWQGGAGIAACWYGGALSLAQTLQRALQQAAPAQRSAFRLAALGKVDVSLQATAALLREAANWIDRPPRRRRRRRGPARAAGGRSLGHAGARRSRPRARRHTLLPRCTFCPRGR